MLQKTALNITGIIFFTLLSGHLSAKQYANRSKDEVFNIMSHLYDKTCDARTARSAKKTIEQCTEDTKSTFEFCKKATGEDLPDNLNQQQSDLIIARMIKCNLFAGSGVGYRHDKPTKDYVKELKQK